MLVLIAHLPVRPPTTFASGRFPIVGPSMPCNSVSAKPPLCHPAVPFHCLLSGFFNPFFLDHPAEVKVAILRHFIYSSNTCNVSAESRCLAVLSFSWNGGCGIVSLSLATGSLCGWKDNQGDCACLRGRQNMLRLNPIYIQIICRILWTSLFYSALPTKSFLSTSEMEWKES